MDVSKFQVEGEWLELNLESEKFKEPIKFLIKPLSSIDQLEYGDAAREDRAKYLEKLYDLVLDWSLTNNGEKLECTPEKRKLYLKYMMPLDLKEEPEEETKEVFADEDKDKEEEEEEEICPTCGLSKSGKEKKKKIKPSVGLAIFEFASDFTNFIKN